MSAENVQSLLARAMTEAEYRELLFSDPDKALAGHDLTADELATRHHHPTPASIFFRLSLVHPGIPGTVRHRPPTCGHADKQALVATASLQHQHPVTTVFAEARGKCSTSRARPHHDIVKHVGQN